MFPKSLSHAFCNTEEILLISLFLMLDYYPFPPCKFDDLTISTFPSKIPIMNYTDFCIVCVFPTLKKDTEFILKDRFSKF